MKDKASRTALLLLWLPTLFAMGCALTNKSEAVTPRYYSPEKPGETAHTAAAASSTRPELRLGRVTHASYLDERIVYRDSEYELGYYEERRWTESPEQYLKRRLSRVLFEDRRIHRVVGGLAPMLETELVAFEEIRAPKRMARVRVIVRLHDQLSVRWEETMTVEQPIGEGDGAGPVVAALGTALRTTVDRIAERVETELAALGVARGATPAPSTSAALRGRVEK